MELRKFACFFCILSQHYYTVAVGNSLRFQIQTRWSRQNLRYGYLNPLLVAPTLPPVTSHYPLCPSGTRISTDGQCRPIRPQIQTSADTKSSYVQESPSVDEKKIEGHRRWDCSLGTKAYEGQCLPLPSHNPKFAHQRPIPVAPTLPPTREPPIDDHNYEIENNNNQWSSSSVSPTTLPTFTINPHDTANKRCPSNLDGIEFRRDAESGSCYALGSEGPCKKDSNMLFYGTFEDPIYGHCDCNLNASRPLIYHPGSDICFFIYQQAYCNGQEWLVFNEKQDPECQLNPCRQYGEEKFKWDWKRNSNMSFMNTEGIIPHYGTQMCVPLGFLCTFDSSGNLVFENPYIHTKGKVILSFEPQHLQPTCHAKRDEPINHPIFTECRPGSKLCILEKCSKDNYFRDAHMSRGGFRHYSDNPTSTTQSPSIGHLKGNAEQRYSSFNNAICTTYVSRQYLIIYSFTSLFILFRFS